VRDMDMTTALVWPQSWGKAEYTTGMPICSAFELAPRNRSRGCESTRTSDENESDTVRADASSLFQRGPRAVWDPGRDGAGQDGCARR
jgi:hypothetical protein